MEGQVLQRRARRLTLAAALAFGLTAVTGQASAGAYATVWGQIISYATQLEQYAQQVSTVENTLASANAAEQELRGLNPSTLGSLTGGQVEQIQQMAAMYQRLNGVMQTAQQSANVLRNAAARGTQAGLTPSQYLADEADLAQKNGGAYAQSFQDDTNTLNSLQGQVADLQRAIAANPQITSEVSGLQTIAASNNRIQAQLISLNAAVVKGNQIRAQEAQTQTARTLGDIKVQKAGEDANAQYRNAASQQQIVIPDPTAISTQGGNGHD